MRIRKALDMAGTVVHARLFNRKKPINIMWRLTNKCNSKCSYCHIYSRKQKELTTEKVLKIIDQMKELGTQRIGFVGGEVLLRKDFELILDYVQNKGIYTTLVSNGHIVPENINIIKKLDCLVLSFDGRKRNHENGRMKGSYAHLFRAFKSCKNNNIKVLTNTVLSRYNLEDIDYILEIAGKYGFNCTFNVLQGGDCYPSNEDYQRTFDHLIARKKKRSPNSIVNKNNEIFKKLAGLSEIHVKAKTSWFQVLGRTVDIQY